MLELLSKFFFIRKNKNENITKQKIKESISHIIKSNRKIVGCKLDKYTFSLLTMNHNMEKQEEEILNFSNEQYSYKLCKKYQGLLENKNVIGADMNKENDLFIITISKNNTRLILQSSTRKRKEIPPNIQFTIRENKMKIDYVDTIHNNIGNGRIAMAYLIQHAKEKRVTEMFGWLPGAESDDHEKRREHFYLRHGFNIDGINISLKL